MFQSLTFRSERSNPLEESAWFSVVLYTCSSALLQGWVRKLPVSGWGGGCQRSHVSWKPVTLRTVLHVPCLSRHYPDSGRLDSHKPVAPIYPNSVFRAVTVVAETGHDRNIYTREISTFSKTGPPSPDEQRLDTLQVLS